MQVRFVGTYLYLLHALVFQLAYTFCCTAYNFRIWQNPHPAMFLWRGIEIRSQALQLISPENISYLVWSNPAN